MSTIALCAAAGSAVDDSAKTSLIAPVGDTVNVSCSSSSSDPVDFYYQPDRDGASPLPLYANHVILEQRYDVTVSSAGQCPRVGDAARHLADGPGLDTASGEARILKTGALGTKSARRQATRMLRLYYRPRSRGDNTFGSVRVCVCVSVRLSVGTLLFEPFDL